MSSCPDEDCPVVVRQQFLLMDEPTGNLDSASEADLLNLLKRLHEQGRTIVMVTHNPAVAGHAQRLVRVKDGRIEEDRGNGA